MSKITQNQQNVGTALQLFQSEEFGKFKKTLDKI